MTTLTHNLAITPSWVVPAKKTRPGLLDWVKSFWTVQHDFMDHYVIRSWHHRLEIVVERDPYVADRAIPPCAWSFWRRLGLDLDRYAGPIGHCTTVRVLH
jgi:hypothetical protein